MAARRLYVYNLINSFSEDNLDFQTESPINEKEIYDLICAIFNENINLTQNYQNLTESNFLKLLLAINNTPEKFHKNLLNFCNIDGILTRGEVYLIVCNLLDENILNVNLNQKDFRDEIFLPEAINITIFSFEDFTKKFEKAISFAPLKIYVNFDNNCPLKDKNNIFKLIMKEKYAFNKGLFNDSEYSYIFSSVNGLAFSVKYEYPFKEHWQLSNNLKAQKVRLCAKALNKLVKNQKIDENLSEFILSLIQWNELAIKDEMIIESYKYNDILYLNADSLDWIKCINNEIISKKIKNEINYVKKWQDLPDYKKVVKIKNYIMNKSSYDYNSSIQEDVPHEIIGYLKNGKIVCDGYAKTFQWLMSILNVDCIVQTGATTINGERSPHAWNKVKIDNNWYNIDICFLDTSNNNAYFLKSDEYFEQHKYNFKNNYNFIATENYKKMGH